MAGWKASSSRIASRPTATAPGPAGQGPSMRAKRGGSTDGGFGARTHLVRSFALEGRFQQDHGQRAKPRLAFIPPRSASSIAEASLHALIATDCFGVAEGHRSWVWDEPGSADPRSWPSEVPGRLDPAGPRKRPCGTLVRCLGARGRASRMGTECRVLGHRATLDRRPDRCQAKSRGGSCTALTGPKPRRDTQHGPPPGGEPGRAPSRTRTPSRTGRIRPTYGKVRAESAFANRLESGGLA